MTKNLRNLLKNGFDYSEDLDVFESYYEQVIYNTKTDEIERRWLKQDLRGINDNKS